MDNYSMAHHQQRSNNVKSAYVTSNKVNFIHKSPLSNNFMPSPMAVDFPSYAAPPPPIVAPKVPPNIFAKPILTSSPKIRLLIGNEHSLLSSSEAKPSPITPGKIDVHHWKIFARSLDGSSLSPYVEKVAFQLHPQFKPSLYVISSPPFELSMNGWGTFPLKVIIYLHAKWNVPPQEYVHKLCFEHGGSSASFDIQLN